METKKQLQVGELIRRNFSQILINEGRFIFENQALVTITQVRISPDLGLAKIYLSVYNTDDKDRIISLLKENTLKLRNSLGTRIRNHVRRIPDILFYLDDTIDEMYRVDEMLRKLQSEGQMGPDETA